MKKKFFIFCASGIALSSIVTFFHSPKPKFNDLLVQNIEALASGESYSGRTAWKMITADNANPYNNGATVIYWNNGNCVEVKVYGRNISTTCF